MVLRFRNSVIPAPRTLLSCLTVTVSCGTWYRVRGTAFVCIMPWLLTIIACIQFLIIGNARALTLSVTEVHRFWASAFLSPGDDRNSNSRGLFHTVIFLLRNSDCLFRGIKIQPQEIGPDWTVCETLHEQRDQRLFIRRIGRDATRKMTYVLNVRVYITIVLFEFLEFRASPELSSRWLKCLPK